jgi:hypothetical protein
MCVADYSAVETGLAFLPVTPADLPPRRDPTPDQAPRKPGTRPSQ